MRENISVFAKDVVTEFRTLDDSQKLYFTSIILNHIYNGLINDGNYVSSDEALENDKIVFEAIDITVDDPMKLATDLLVIAASKEGITINPNGIDIETYIKNKNSLNKILSMFYKLELVDKIDFLTEIIYDISEIKEVEKLDFDFNELINEFLTYRRETFGGYESNSLETI